MGLIRVDTWLVMGTGDKRDGEFSTEGAKLGRKAMNSD